MTMRFIKGSPEDAVKNISKRLLSVLSSGQPLLWLTSGGSDIPIQKAVMDNLPDDLTTILTIMPVDERVVPYNHADSNTTQLRRAGFNPKHAEWIDILEEDLSPSETINLYKDCLARRLLLTPIFL